MPELRENQWKYREDNGFKGNLEVEVGKSWYLIGYMGEKEVRIATIITNNDCPPVMCQA